MFVITGSNWIATGNDETLYNSIIWLASNNGNCILVGGRTFYQLKNIVVLWKSIVYRNGRDIPTNLNLQPFYFNVFTELIFNWRKLVSPMVDDQESTNGKPSKQSMKNLDNIKVIIINTREVIATRAACAVHLRVRRAPRAARRDTRRFLYSFYY